MRARFTACKRCLNSSNPLLCCLRAHAYGKRKQDTHNGRTESKSRFGSERVLGAALILSTVFLTNCVAWLAGNVQRQSLLGVCSLSFLCHVHSRPCVGAMHDDAASSGFIRVLHHPSASYSPTIFTIRIRCASIYLPVGAAHCVV